MSAGLMVWVRREARHVVSQQELYRATTGPDQSQYPIGRSGWRARRSDRRKQRGMVNSVTHRSLTGKAGARSEAVMPGTQAGEGCRCLGRIRGFAFDLDGTIWAGPTLLPGAAALVADVRAAGLKVIFASNSSRHGAARLARRLTEMGIEAGSGDV